MEEDDAKKKIHEATENKRKSRFQVRVDQIVQRLNFERHRVSRESLELQKI